MRLPYPSCRLLVLVLLAGVLLFAGAAGLRAHQAGDDPSGHWSLWPVSRPTVPAVRDVPWVRNPIDAFVLHKLEAVGLAPSPAAESRTLIRRLSFDLTGLPPTPEEVSTFLADQSPDAYEKLVDRPLASPA